MKYRITVSSIGYDSTTMVVESENKAKAMKDNRDAAIAAWQDRNDIEGCERLPHVGIERL